MSDVILEVKNLKKYFKTSKGMLHAVDDVSFTLERGTTLGVVGESGCGKSTLGRSILRLIEPTSGEVLFEGKDVSALSTREMRHMRKDMQIIFQDPYSSLDPRKTVYQAISEPIIKHKLITDKAALEERVLELMETVGLAERLINTYPHELDGGRRQRIGIARALALNPKFIVCDEPVSALDVSIQAQIINLLKKLQRERNMAYVFISHDLSVVKFISDKILVMYLGAVMEFGTKEAIFTNPMHPYTKALFSAVPNPDPTMKMDRIKLQGDIPSPANPPKGCRFHTRCPYAKEVCKHVTPEYTEYEKGHFAACHLLNEEQ